MIQHFVYFIQENDADPAMIKIGTTMDIEARLRQIQNSLPRGATLLGAIHCESKSVALAYEKELHKKFADARRNGEWFMPTHDIIDFAHKNATYWNYK